MDNQQPKCSYCGTVVKWKDGIVNKILTGSPADKLILYYCNRECKAGYVKRSKAIVASWCENEPLTREQVFEIAKKSYLDCEAKCELTLELPAGTSPEERNEVGGDYPVYNFGIRWEDDRAGRKLKSLMDSKLWVSCWGPDFEYTDNDISKPGKNFNPHKYICYMD